MRVPTHKISTADCNLVLFTKDHYSDSYLNNKHRKKDNKSSQLKVLNYLTEETVGHASKFC